MSQFLDNGYLKGLMIQDNVPPATVEEKHWANIVAHEQPRALPPYSGSAASAIPGLSLATPASQGNEPGVESGEGV